jgi:hypothetical protein
MKTLSSLLPLLATIPLAAPALAGDLSLDLYAGQHELIGQVLVCDDGSDLFVTYDAEGGAVMSTTHLYASLDAPKKHSPGRFGYKNEGISSSAPRRATRCTSPRTPTPSSSSATRSRCWSWPPRSPTR